ncbi:MAG: hypothetical protein VKJ86_08305 [Synechococcus sp.]|nr:hypothetical protein [Synechococcus sp.]
MLTEISEPKEYSAEILELQAAIATDPTDMVAQISLASALEGEGFFTEAIDAYQRIISQDPEGVFAASATKALEDLQSSLAAQDPTTPDVVASTVNPGPKPLIYDEVDYTNIDVTSPPLKRLLNLSIAKKQFIGLSTGQKLYGVKL